MSNHRYHQAKSTTVIFEKHIAYFAKDPYHQLSRVRREIALNRQMDELLSYLAMHEPEMIRKVLSIRNENARANIRMRNHIRKVIGEKNWRKFLDYYSHYSRTGKRIEIKENASHIATPPPFPKLSHVLDDDTTAHIFSFLDNKSLYEASKVSREYRDALVPRQRFVTMQGFRSLRSFLQMNFSGMVCFDAAQSNLVTDELIQILSLDRRSYPNLERVNTDGCNNVFYRGLALFRRNMGPRFESWEDDLYEEIDKYLENSK